MAESAEYTPTLEDMRAVWVSHRAFNNYERSFGKFWEVKADAEFTRWLETVRAVAKAEAWDEGVGDSESLMCMTPPCGSCKNCDTPLINPYK